MIKQVMVRAHQIAKTMTGNYAARMSAALRLAWRQVRLLLAGGSEWIKGSMHRIYFNDLASWFGLQIDTYKTGNISYAELNGERISNSQARKVENRLFTAKFWYDVAEGRFHGQNMSAEDFQTILQAVRAATHVA
jgi:hypothetical protein